MTYPGIYQRRIKCRHNFEWPIWDGSSWRWDCSNCGLPYRQSEHIDCKTCEFHPSDEQLSAKGPTDMGSICSPYQ